MSNTVKILYAGNFANEKYLPLRPIKTFKRSGLTSAAIQPHLLLTLNVSRRACLVTCVDGKVTTMDNWTRDGAGKLDVVTELRADDAR